MPNNEREHSLRFREEIIECLVTYSNIVEGDSNKSKRKSAEEYLNDSFFISGGDYYNPNYDTLLRALKVLATKELKTGKERKIISENFLRIAGRIKLLQQNQQ